MIMEKKQGAKKSLFEIPENLQDLSKEELISVIESLRKKNNSQKPAPKDKKGKPFDFQKYSKRHVALKFLYLGWDYCGFAVQDTTDKTIEAELFKALERTKLLEHRETSNYHRCGRTDKGVSAFSQVVSLDLRSNLTEEKDVIKAGNVILDNKKETEINYVGILNRVLPHEIRVIAWAPVDQDFSARFDCYQRTYKYWFPVGELDIKKMNQAAQKLIGEHDFRNFCKMDVANGVTNFRRKIFDVYIRPINESPSSPYNIMEFTIVGQAFLYHQIRCIIHVLFLIGQGKEECEIVDQLLDIENCPRKPQYAMASELPLVLFDCQYQDIEWKYDQDSLKYVIKQLQSIWSQNTIKSVISKRMLDELETICTDVVINQNESLNPGVKPRVYKRLLDRNVCESLEERIEHFSKKLKQDLIQPKE
ncbi:tRNA pseudouridine(38/39) synthase-like [Uloborus diversus]|uniref:tRNA pseudouridine(38/39) synthase-like n=1 Tax=Uloborus diversus TaxID=327109 RepID=UPI00240A56B8|nr:tRNA pseudouridine(38/39) synthase-like [Uloborus diversus]